MKGPRWVSGPASLSGRVTLTASALLVVILLVLLTAVDLALNARLQADARTRLTDRVSLAQQLDTSLPAQELVDRLRGDGVTAQLCVSGTTDCVVADSTPRPRGPGKTRDHPLGAARRPAPPAAIQGAGSVLYVRTTLSGDHVLTLSTDTTQISQALHRLVALEVVGGAGAVLLAAAVLSRLSRVALRPLDDMTILAGRIAGGDRGRRLNPTRSDTELGRTAAAFDGMLDELEDALDAAHDAEARMRDFLGDASHELRTPLAGLQANAEYLVRERPGHAETERIGVAMVREARRAAGLVADLLAIARLDQGQGLALRAELFDLVQLARHELDRARLLGPDRQFHLAGNEEVLVLGDPAGLGQVLANLLDNARHATSPGDHVSVEVVGNDAGGAVVTVCDTGVGVADGDRERIFERFARVDLSRSRSTGGAGLGLAIARGLARAHGGELTCAEGSGAGACFRLVLPGRGLDS